MTEEEMLAIETEFVAKVTEIMNDWVKALSDVGTVTGIDGPDDMSGDDEHCTRASLAVHLAEKDEVFDISISLESSVAFQGEPFEGYAVSCMGVWEGGRIGWQWSPHNYTPQVWTMDKDEVFARLALIADQDIAEAIRCQF